MVTVAGLDGWKGGWVAVFLVEGRFDGVFTAHSLEASLPRLTGAAVIGIDMPIGFPSSGTRRADLAARSFVGPRHNSVFLVPPRHIIEPADYATARRAAKRLWDRGLTAQTYALREKMLELNAMVERDPRFIEVHPEVSFRALNGEGVRYSKRTWNGQQQRLRLLESAGVEIPEELLDAEGVPPDDLIDATVVAWSAHRRALRQANHLPHDADPAAEPVIWY